MKVVNKRSYLIATTLNFCLETYKKPTKNAMKEYEDAIWLWVTEDKPLPDTIKVWLRHTTLWDSEVAEEDNPIKRI